MGVYEQLSIAAETGCVPPKSHCASAASQITLLRSLLVVGNRVENQVLVDKHQWGIFMML